MSDDGRARDENFVDPADKYVGRPGCLNSLWSLACTAVFLIVTLWTFGAIYWDGPAHRGSGNTVVALAWALTTVTLVLAFKSPLRRALVWFVCLAVVLIPWSTIQPSHDRDWQPDWRETGWAEVFDDKVIIHNFRNFDYQPDGELTERWETRTVHLSNLRGLDYFQVNFAGDLIAHPIFSFDFGDEGHVALSIETRREADEPFTNLGGLYKVYELQYLFGDERDLVRVRTNIREEPVRLYRTTFDSEQARRFFLTSVNSLNELRERPRWYNLFTANCTTSVRAQRPSEDRESFDYRMLANGKLDEYLYEKEILAGGDLSFPRLRDRARINEAAQAAHDDPRFSQRIRAGRVGFDSTAPAEE